MSTQRTGWMAPQLARRLSGLARIVSRPRPYFDRGDKR